MIVPRFLTAPKSNPEGKMLNICRRADTVYGRGAGWAVRRSSCSGTNCSAIGGIGVASRPAGIGSKAVHRRGFALVIALGLMAFVLLLILSLSSLVRVESATAENAKVRLMARQNALLGLQVGLGRLQASAGPDRRATGRLEVDASLSVDPSKRFWTGAWRNDTSGGDPYDASRNLVRYRPMLEDILVSGEPTPENAAIGPIVLGGSETALPDDVVRVPSVRIEGRSADGSYAFWVGDEGIKARVDLRDPSSLAAEDPNFVESNAPSRLLTMPRFGAERMRLDQSGSPVGDAFPSEDPALSSVLMNGDLAHLFAEGDAFARARFHDLTIHSKGVLSDQRLGGLRQDLTWMLRNEALPEGALYSEPVSVINRPGPLPGPAWSLIQDFYTLAAEPVLSPQAGENVRSIGDLSDHRSTVGPVITQVKLYFNFALGPEETTPPNAHGGHLRMYLFPVVALYNPYNEPLAGRDYFIELPQHNTRDSTELRVEILDSAGTPIASFGGYKFKDGLDALFSPQARSGGNDRSGTIHFRALDLDFEAGETKILSLAQGGLYEGELNTNLVTHTPSGAGNLLRAGFDESKSAYIEFRDTLPTGSDPAFYSFELANEGVLRLRMGLLDGNDSVLASYDSIAYNAFDSVPTSGIDQGSNLTVFPKAGFSYKMDLESIRHLVNFNLRSNHMTFSGFDSGPPLTSPPPLYRGNFGIGDFATNTDGAGGGFFGPAHSGAGYHRTALFEVPAEPDAFVSLGQLRHLDLSIKHLNPAQGADRTNLHAPTHVFGNSLADPRVGRGFTFRDFNNTEQWWRSSLAFDYSYRVNEALMDGFFFSTLPEPDEFENGEPLVNRRLARVGTGAVSQSTAFDAARQWLVEGAFNVNSTSVDAWRALLAGLQDHDLITQEAGTESDVDFLFPNTSRPLSASFLGSSAADGFDLPVWRGARRLSAAEIDALAEAIVDQVRQRGPFLSLAHFVNRDPDADGELARAGALQLAIENAGLNEGFRGDAITEPPDELDVPEPDLFLGHAFDLAPGHLSQSSLLSPLLPTLAARSDTFRIRAYGEVTDRVGTGTEARALCEAIVQRLPGKVDSDEMVEAPPAEEGYGRRFHIVAIRWLEPPKSP